MTDHKLYPSRILRSTRRLWAVAIACVFVMVFIEAGFQVHSKIKMADNTTKSLIYQVQTIVENYNAANSTLQESLKEEYIIRARAVSYAIENINSADISLDELKKIADLMEVDDIHLFSREGIIYSGTNPKYNGLNVNLGGQIGFFKQMLMDTTLSLCQDMQPNTAEGKKMMYAMVWRNDRSGLVQVGIEPTRLLKELNNHKISETVKTFPIVDGEAIFISDVQTGIILGATNPEDIGKDLSIIKPWFSKFLLGTHFATIHDQYTLTNTLSSGKYLITASLNLDVVNQGIPRALLILFLYLIFAAYIVYRVARRLNSIYIEKQMDYDVLHSISEMYNSVHLIDLEENTSSEYSATEIVRQLRSKATKATEQFRIIMDATITDEYKEKIFEFIDLKTLPQRMKGKKAIACEVIGRNIGWSRFTFIVLSEDENGVLKKVIFTSESIDAQKKEEEQLLLNSTTDELTKLFNRRAFEKDTEKYKTEKLPQDILIVSLDLNELKKTNDTLGHMAGDDLIVSSANCMRKHFRNFGRIYRMGGDEFALILKISEKEFVAKAEEFYKDAANWNGEIIQGLSFSLGFVSGVESEGKTFAEVMKIADERMYTAKRQYYSSKGLDRRR